MKIKWCVSSGPNYSHLWECEWFDRLNDAMEFIKTLSEYCGMPRAYKLERFQFYSDFGIDSKIKLIDSRR